MSVYFVTGKLGAGKGLVVVGKIRDALRAGKPVATNLDLFLEYLLPKNNNKAVVYRLPDRPTVFDLAAIGRGTNSYDESNNGLLVLDECATWLNARTYQEKLRKEVIDWLIHARKLGWDVYIIVQNENMLDKQIREALGELIVRCRRTDKIPIPVIGWLFSVLTGGKLPLPRIHVGSVFYGEGAAAIKVDTWAFRGNDLFKCYDTKQIFRESRNRIAQYIPPASLNLKKFAVRNGGFYMRLTKIYWKKVKVPFAFAAGLLLNFIFLAVLLTVSGHKSAADQVAQEDLRPGSPPSASPGQVRIENNKQEKKETNIMAQVTPWRRVPVSYAQEVDSNGISRFRFVVDGYVYSLTNFPYELKWDNGQPYYLAKDVENTPHIPKTKENE